MNRNDFISQLKFLIEKYENEEQKLHEMNNNWVESQSPEYDTGLQYEQEQIVDNSFLDIITLFNNRQYFNTNNFKHPEIKNGEILLLNVKDGEDWESNLPIWIDSVRRGEVAYVTDGSKVVHDMKPLFAKFKTHK